MTIHLYTLCWNEIDILPFVIDYWKRLNIARAVVYDNGSTDGSIEFLNQYDWIEVRHYDSNNEIRDDIYLEIKNNAWKESKGKCDWVIVCDMDEIIFSNHLEEELDYMKKYGHNAMGCPWYAMCFDKKPTYDPNKLLHTQGTMFYKQPFINLCFKFNKAGKVLLFDPNIIDEINYTYGCHKCEPTPYFFPYISQKILEFHINKGLSENYFVERRKILGERLSEENKKINAGLEYLLNEETNREYYRAIQKRSIDVNKFPDCIPN